jgi:hypothetical protein
MRPVQMTVILAAAILSFGAASSAVEASEDRNDSETAHACTNETLQGTYGIQIQGTQLSAPGGPIESVIGVVLRNYDGLGQFTQVGNVKGSISGWVPDRVGGGTYDVGADCTAIAHLQPRPGVFLEERLIIVDDGREIQSASMMPLAAMVTGVARRLHRH